MQIQAYKTKLVVAGDDLQQVITAAIPTLPERSIVVVASKIVSTCENRFVTKKSNEKNEKHELVKQEAEYFLEPDTSKYNLMLTVKRNWLFVNAGIDESNADNQFILWPADPQKSVNALWEFLRKHYGVKEVGVTMSDSTSRPLNYGVTGHAIAHCGFEPLRDYIGTKDLFGREMVMEKLNVMQSVTAAAVCEMGEGNEQTPVAVVSDISNTQFYDHTPTAAELSSLHIDLVDDAYAPLLINAPWKKGKGGG